MIALKEVFSINFIEMVSKHIREKVNRR